MTCYLEANYLQFVSVIGGFGTELQLHDQQTDRNIFSVFIYFGKDEKLMHIALCVK